MQCCAVAVGSLLNAIFWMNFVWREFLFLDTIQQAIFESHCCHVEAGGKQRVISDSNSTCVVGAASMGMWFFLPFETGSVWSNWDGMWRWCSNYPISDPPFRRIPWKYHFSYVVMSEHWFDFVQNVKLNGEFVSRLEPRFFFSHNNFVWSCWRIILKTRHDRVNPS